MKDTSSGLHAFERFTTYSILFYRDSWLVSTIMPTSLNRHRGCLFSFLGLLSSPPIHHCSFYLVPGFLDLFFIEVAIPYLFWYHLLLILLIVPLVVVSFIYLVTLRSFWSYCNSFWSYIFQIVIEVSPSLYIIKEPTHLRFSLVHFLDSQCASISTVRRTTSSLYIDREKISHHAR